MHTQLLIFLCLLTIRYKLIIHYVLYFNCPQKGISFGSPIRKDNIIFIFVM